MENNKSKDWLEQVLEWMGRNRRRSLFITISVLLGVFFLIPFAITHCEWGFAFDEDSSYVADSVAGTVGVGVACIAALLTFVAFWVQYKANVQQRESILHDRIEGRFFELIRLYRDSVDEMEIQDKRKGRACFIPMFKEFRCVYFIAKYEEGVFRKANGTKKIDDRKLCEIAYSIFFNGVGIESNKLRRDADEKYEPFLKHLDNVIYDIQVWYRELESANNDDANKSLNRRCFIYFDGLKYWKKIGTIRDILEIHKEATTANNEDAFVFEPKYYPFDGHITRLGHYYRNLFEIVRFIVSKIDYGIDKKEAMQYLKLLRKQMSNHEQLLLYYNGVSGAGEKWIKDPANCHANYFIDYQMIHNVPFPYADFGIPITTEFAYEIKNAKDTFEWQWNG